MIFCGTWFGVEKNKNTPEPEYKVPPHFSNGGKKKKSAYH